jgi:hypothetical protein
VVTCALVAFDRTMCSAVRRRMFENGTTTSPAGRDAPAGAAAGAGSKEAATGGATVGLGGGAAGCGAGADGVGGRADDG